MPNLMKSKPLELPIKMTVSGEDGHLLCGEPLTVSVDKENRSSEPLVQAKAVPDGPRAAQATDRDDSK